MISIIVPTTRDGAFLSNVAKSLGDAVRSGGLQGRAEIVFGDDGWGMAENEVSALEGFLDGLAIRAVRTPTGPRAGPSAARNTAIRASTGKYIFPLDDDDLFLSNRFPSALAILESGKADAVLERTIRSEVGAGPGVGMVTGPPDDAIDPLDMLLSGNWSWSVSQGATSFTREAFERVGGFNERLRFAEDGEFLCKLAATCRVALLPGDPVTRYHYHNGNCSAPQNVFPWQNVKMLSELYRFLRKADCSARHRAFVREMLRAKFDYAMWAAWNQAPVRRDRYRAVYESLRAFPSWLYTRRNVLSATNALLRSLGR